MDRSLPSANKILYKKWQSDDKEKHYRHLRDARPIVDIKTPGNFSHIKNKAKRDQLLEDRFTEIERENRILLEKMHNIFQTKKSVGIKKNQKGSLNFGYRKKVMNQINTENRQLLARLKNKSSCYSAREWEKDRKNTEKRLRSMGEYPYLIGNRGNSSLKPHRIPPPPSGISLVFKREIPIRGRWFVIEIFKMSSMVKIKVEDIEDGETFSLKLRLTDAYDIMGGVPNWEAIIRQLDLENGELVLYQAQENSFSGFGYTNKTIGHIDLEDLYG
ncbi:unnamed protein product [Blepharisma stoltei]|uniref:Uncharacterized protein n=1 Tax=Blepharisma stoltei TaxID=1481888 RepID=A0AAU9JEK9_9CILI|nr:unnamed protein product [Blepharisma stoltei]